MIGLVNSQNSVVNTTAAIKTLARAIIVAGGDFSLLLACCNSSKRQQDVLSLLKEYSPVDIEEIIIPPSSDTLFTTIRTKIGSSQPEALMIRGLESVTAINQLIVSTNLMRDELRKQFHFPLVLWVNDDILRRLVWLAPDLKDWAACTIRFDLNQAQLAKAEPISA
ncbi:WD-repeat protein [Calothrix sp. NIES-4101]|uniref:hypothetical protein n=1 Tax=Calothrix sp. UHCC 0171 TaxID=3110245 RepID=UPI000B5F50FC|nr:hypothetical protein [Calothrix sp. UHCC 0171]MEA5569864.1 hypothetical protein [Calothrix sp. UHCC 0171]BAZ39984.1 WD-repeat protein [Calothrix sp. NIES-4101]